MRPLVYFNQLLHLLSSIITNKGIKEYTTTNEEEVRNRFNSDIEGENCKISESKTARES